MISCGAGASADILHLHRKTMVPGAGATAATGPEQVPLLARGAAVAASGGGEIKHCGLPH
jgi:hypothetical protein